MWHVLKTILHLMQSGAEHDDCSDTPATEADSSGSADSDGSEGEGSEELSEDQSEVEDGDTEQEGAPTRAGKKKHVAVKKVSKHQLTGCSVQHHNQWWHQ
jgi:hypothetical protein